MPITDILSSVYAVAKAVYEQVELVKANQAQCKRIAERIEVIVKAVKKLDGIKDGEQYRPGLVALKTCLDNCLVFVKNFSQDKSWFKQVLKAGTDEKKFALLNDELEKTITQLNLGLNAQQIINREHDRADQKHDYHALQKQQDVIIQLNQKANGALQKLQLQQQEGNAILAQQLASMRMQIAAVFAHGPVKKKTPIDANLMVPYYEIAFDEKLAEGSFGKVYLGQWCQQSVAIKTLEGKLSAEDMHEFTREVNILSRLRHKNVVQLYGACIEAERPCLVMEHLEKGSLYRVLHGSVAKTAAEKTEKVEPLTPEQQKQFALELARGLFYLHNQNILHCDLKSANILVGANNEIKIADFGLSKTKAASIASLNKTSQAIQWLAPECFKRDTVYTKAADVYSYGVILCEIVTGKKPFADCKDDVAKLVQAGKREPLPKEMPAVYRTLIQQCWQQDPIQRPNLSTIIEQLEAYQPEAALSAEQHYQHGLQHETKKDYPKAYKSYQASADKGYFKAHTNLGFFFLTGKGGAPIDKPKALQCFSTAAASGHARAMMNLATMLESGDGVPVDSNKALTWYEQAHKSGDQTALLKSQKLQSKLLATQPASTAAATAAQHQVPNNPVDQKTAAVMKLKR